MWILKSQSLARMEKPKKARAISSDILKFKPRTSPTVNDIFARYNFIINTLNSFSESCIQNLLRWSLSQWKSFYSLLNFSFKFRSSSHLFHFNKLVYVISSKGHINTFKKFFRKKLFIITVKLYKNQKILNLKTFINWLIEILLWTISKYELFVTMYTEFWNIRIKNSINPFYIPILCADIFRS